MSDHEIDHEYTDEVVCPYCGHEHGDSFEMTEGYQECDGCGKRFEMWRDVTVTYVTRKVRA